MTKTTDGTISTTTNGKRLRQEVSALLSDAREHLPKEFHTRLRKVSVAFFDHRKEVGRLQQRLSDAERRVEELRKTAANQDRQSASVKTELASTKLRIEKLTTQLARTQAELEQSVIGSESDANAPKHIAEQILGGRMISDSETVKQVLLALGAWEEFDQTDLPVGFLKLPEQLQIFYQQKGLEQQERNFLLWFCFDTEKEYDRALDQLHQRMQPADRIVQTQVPRPPAMAIVNISEDAKQHEFCTLVGKACLDRALTVAQQGDMDYLVSTFCGGNFIVETRKERRRKGFTWRQRLMLRHEADADPKVSAEMETPSLRGHFFAEIDH